MSRLTDGNNEEDYVSKVLRPCSKLFPEWQSMNQRIQRT